MFSKLFGKPSRVRGAKAPLLIIALVAAIGFSMVSCDSSGGGGGGSGGSFSFTIRNESDRAITAVRVYNIPDPNNWDIKEERYNQAINIAPGTTSPLISVSGFNLTIIGTLWANIIATVEDTGERSPFEGPRGNGETYEYILQTSSGSYQFQ